MRLLLVVWRSRNVVGRINEVTLRRARLVLGWVTVFGREKPPQYFTKPFRPTQPPTLSGTGNEYQPKCGDALRLRSSLYIAIFVLKRDVKLQLTN